LFAEPFANADNGIVPVVISEPSIVAPTPAATQAEPFQIKSFLVSVSVKTELTATVVGFVSAATPVILLPAKI